VALITLNPVEGAQFARAYGIINDLDDLSRLEPLRKLVEKIIAEVNARVSSTESIKKFAILDHDFEIEKDEVTPTGKLKREVVVERYRDLIQSLYT
jgi:long-chain acyl-CoA synthetase